MVVQGARLRKGSKAWSAPFLLADTPGYPDTNATIFLDPKKRLWLMWPTILANEWHTALMKYKIASDYRGDGAPKWDVNEVLHVTPGDEFAATVNREIDRMLVTAPQTEQVKAYADRQKKNAADKLYRRLGWMTRAHPYVLDGTRLIVPLYSDGFSFSLMAISDDWGATWKTSTPLVGRGNIQPSLARKKDGTLVAYMRDNGPAPKRLMISRSSDRGDTWSAVEDSDLPNPGAGAEVTVLAERQLGAHLQRPRTRPVPAGRVAVGGRGADVALDPPSGARPGFDRRAAARSVPLPVDHPGGRRHAARHLQFLRAGGVGHPGRREAAAAQVDQARAFQ